MDAAVYRLSERCFANAPRVGKDLSVGLGFLPAARARRRLQTGPPSRAEDRSPYERFAIPFTFKPQLGLDEALIAAGAAFLRILFGSVLFAVWGVYSVLAWTSIRSLVWRAGALLLLFIVFLLAVALLMAAIAAPSESKRTRTRISSAFFTGARVEEDIVGRMKRPKAGSAMPGSKDGDSILELRSVAEWNAWLRANHDRPAGVLLRIWKKGASDSTLTYAAALEAALAWGWIDGQKRALDDAAWLQRFTRRTRRSPWSKINRAKAEALIASGQMQEPGLAEVDRAKRDGRWERAYDGAKTSTDPDDLAVALDGDPRARAFFETLEAANRYAIIYRVTTAKVPETRASRIATFVAMCAAHQTLHPGKTKTAKAKSKASRARGRPP